ncbi:hypothetical protein ES705_39804 [subsurface metagenome]
MLFWLMADKSKTLKAKKQIGFHPHIHCIVPAGGITEKGDWKNAPNNNGFLFHFKALANTFRGKFLWYLRDMYDANEMILPMELKVKNTFVELVKQLKNIQWNVKIKDPFDNPNHVTEYLGRYTNRIAIANSRIKSIDTKNHSVTFTYTDRNDGNKIKERTIPVMKFIKLFVQHFLPKGFMKIRNYGIFSSRTKTQDLENARNKLSVPDPGPKPKLTIKQVLLITKGIDIEKCPHCGGKMVVTEIINPTRGPPRKLPLAKHCNIAS